MSSYVYLFGDLFVEKAGVFDKFDVPCRDVQVNKKQLAAAALASSFVSLLEAGEISLQPAKAKSLVFFTREVLHVDRKSAVAHAPGERSTGSSAQETAILNTLRGRKGDTVKDVAWRLLPEDSPDPWQVVLGFIRRELIDQGYFVSEERTGIGRVLGDKLVPACEKIAALEPEAREVKSRLDSFQNRESQLYALLLKQVHDGIGRRTEKPDTASD